jgi:Transposase DDE domain
MKKDLTAPLKDSYKVKNWQAYNKSLRQRGQITLWIEASVLRQWGDINPKIKVVGEQQYPSSVIQCCLILGYQYGQKLRQTTGFVGSLLALMGKGEYAVPDYTTLSRRQSCLPVEVSERWTKGEKIEIGIDSTGLKVYGEGEWKVRKHGVSKRRTWRKLHIGIDIVSQEIISVELTGNDEDDAAVAEKMLRGKIDRLRSFRGDGAYDDFHFREALGKEVKQIIPPPIDAVVHDLSKGTKTIVR